MADRKSSSGRQKSSSIDKIWLGNKHYNHNISLLDLHMLIRSFNYWNKQEIIVFYI
jgi:hypothetical protein